MPGSKRLSTAEPSDSNPTRKHKISQPDYLSQVNEGVLIEIISHLDAVSIVYFLSSSKRLYGFKQKSNNIITERVTPYQRYITIKYWNAGLILASSKNDILQIEYFLEKGADAVNHGMYEAAEKGNMELVKYFISKGACRWNTALGHAAYGGHKNLAEFFRGKGAHNELIGFINAVRGGHKELADYFLQKRPGKDLIWRLGIEHAAKGRQKDLLWKFLNKIASLDSQVWCEILCLVAKSGFRDVVDFVLQKGATNWHGGMVCAAKGGHKELVEYFFSLGVDVMLDQGLKNAVLSENMDIVKLMIEHGADDWNIGLSAAARRGNRELVDFFIEKGACHWTSALESAAKGGHRELVDFFLDKDAEITTAALYEAVSCGYQDLVTFFIDNAEDLDVQAAMHVAIEKGYPAIVRQLEEAGADVWNDFLMTAVESGDLELVKYFISKGAWDFKQGMEIAKLMSHQNVMEYLSWCIR